MLKIISGLELSAGSEVWFSSSCGGTDLASQFCSSCGGTTDGNGNATYYGVATDSSAPITYEPALPTNGSLISISKDFSVNMRNPGNRGLCMFEALRSSGNHLSASLKLIRGADQRKELA